VPVVMVSAVDDFDTVLRCIKLGTDDRPQGQGQDGAGALLGTQVARCPEFASRRSELLFEPWCSSRYRQCERPCRAIGLELWPIILGGRRAASAHRHWRPTSSFAAAPALPADATRRRVRFRPHWSCRRRKLAQDDPRSHREHRKPD
jgi:hypothetical protein